MKILNAVMATMAFASTAALAGTSHYTATLAQPLTVKKEFIANGNAWHCDGSTCFLASEPIDAASVRSCRALMLQVGALTAYGKAGKSFDSDTLAKCNAKN
jgi:hypothetical protein